MSIKQNVSHLSKPNRIISHRMKLGSCWCDFCDRDHVYIGSKCSVCGKINGKKRLKLKSRGEKFK